MTTEGMNIETVGIGRMTTDDVLAVLHEKATKYADSLVLAEQDRADRDRAIRTAAERGMGVREIARACGMDASQVSKMLRA